MERSDKMKNVDGILASGLWLGTVLVWVLVWVWD